MERPSVMNDWQKYHSVDGGNRRGREEREMNVNGTVICSAPLQWKCSSIVGTESFHSQ